MTKAVSNGAAQDSAANYDPFQMASISQSLPGSQYNPYADEHATASASTGFYPGSGPFAAPLQPLQHHLYVSYGPRREGMMPYHRLTRDFFLPEDVRQESQRKMEAALQVLPNSQLPQLENYHSLVPLDTTYRKNANIFGFPSWVYKAMSSKTGHLCCLRRLEGYRLTNEQAIRSVKEWKKVDCANVVAIQDAFTVRAFGDSSLVFVQDYFPLSKTLAEHHLTPSPVAPGNRFQPKPAVPEALLWSYITQIANALKAIHALNLAARCIDVTKILITDHQRIRLNACSILDVVHYELRRPVLELQQDDFIQFGRVILCLATGTLPGQLTNLKAPVEQMSRSYSVELRDTVIWLLTPAQPPAHKGIEELINGIAGHVMTTLDQTLHGFDSQNAHLTRELENGRIARLCFKLAVINERHDVEGDRAWAENGERYMLKLFRDYVFHQVDGNGTPVLDMGHMLRCLNKLDAGTEERICLTSRDEQTSFIVSYKEVKKQLGNAFGELLKSNKSGRAT